MKKSNARDARYWVEKLKLAPHPEGGYFRQTYKSDLIIPGEAINHCGARAASTAIYFLLEGENFSAFHRLRSDEMWHFYAGSPLVVHVLSPDRSYATILLGSDPEARQVFQAVVPAGHWFASHVASWKGWALVGCTVAPGFEFEDFEIGKREELVKEYPEHADIIRRLTRPK
jgi:predicted cupin superfamily sugar epimerase